MAGVPHSRGQPRNHPRADPHPSTRRTYSCESSRDPAAMAARPVVTQRADPGIARRRPRARPSHHRAAPTRSRRRGVPHLRHAPGLHSGPPARRQAQPKQSTIWPNRTQDQSWQSAQGPNAFRVRRPRPGSESGQGLCPPASSASTEPERSVSIVFRGWSCQFSGVGSPQARLALG